MKQTPDIFIIKDAQGTTWAVPDTIKLEAGTKNAGFLSVRQYLDMCIKRDLAHKIVLPGPCAPVRRS